MRHRTSAKAFVAHVVRPARSWR